MFLGTILFVIPVDIQMPFRVLFLVLFNYLVVISMKVIPVSMVIIPLIIGLFIMLKLINGTFDTSLLILLLSTFPVYYFNKLDFHFFKEKRKVIRSVIVFWLLAIIIQMLIFRYEGRPTLSYEINQSGSYLFIFYILSDINRQKLIKCIVCILSFLMLSRLLIVCIVLFELLKHLKIVTKKSCFFTYNNIVILSFIFISIFSLCFFLNMSDNLVEGSNDISRLTTFNDQSNFIRFKINSQVLVNLFTGNDPTLLNLGYGDVGKNMQYREIYFLMPHNEVFKGIVQFGIAFVIFCFFISRNAFHTLVNINSAYIFIPLVFYTLILWVRFTVLPSPEMIFILFVLKNSLILHSYESMYCRFKYNSLRRN